MVTAGHCYYFPASWCIEDVLAPLVPLNQKVMAGLLVVTFHYKQVFYGSCVYCIFLLVMVSSISMKCIFDKNIYIMIEFVRQFFLLKQCERVHTKSWYQYLKHQRRIHLCYSFRFFIFDSFPNSHEDSREVQILYDSSLRSTHDLNHSLMLIPTNNFPPICSSYRQQAQLKSTIIKKRQRKHIRNYSLDSRRSSHCSSRATQFIF